MFTQIKQEAEERELLRTLKKTEEPRVCVCVCELHDCLHLFVHSQHQLQPGVLHFGDGRDEIPALSCILQTHSECKA